MSRLSVSLDGAIPFTHQAIDRVSPHRAISGTILRDNSLAQISKRPDQTNARKKAANHEGMMVGKMAAEQKGRWEAAKFCEWNFLFL